MKLLHLPLNVPGSEQIGQEKGFRNVFEECRVFDYLTLQGINGKGSTNQELCALVNEFKPDIIWAQLQETDVITPETWQTIRRDFPKIWLTCWSGDARTYVPTGMQQWLRYFDVFYNDTDQWHLYEPHCKRYEFMPIAVDPDEVTDFSHPTPYEREIIFIGNNYGETFTNGKFRADLMHHLSVVFGDKFGVIGTGWDSGQVTVLGSCPVKHQGAYYNKAQVCISVDHIQDILHWSERLIWCLGSGTPTVVQYQPEIERWFKDDNTCLYFKTPEECVEKINYLLHNKQYAQSIGARGKREVLTNHIWSKRAQQVKDDYDRSQQ